MIIYVTVSSMSQIDPSEIFSIEEESLLSYNRAQTNDLLLDMNKKNVGDCSWGWLEESFFNSCNTEV